MNFYELMQPEYTSDQAARRHNPVSLIPGISAPSILCDNCGLWSSSVRIRRKFSFSQKAQEIINKAEIDASKWKEEMDVLGKEIGIDAELIKPGAELDIPMGELGDVDFHDFTNPFPGQIWVKKCVMDSILHIQAKGVDFCKVETKPRKNNNRMIELWELIITGTAWRKGATYKSIIACDKCNRLSFPDPEWLNVDESTWDGIWRFV